VLNRYGRLAALIARLDAASFRQARQIAHDLIQPFVSWLSYAHDVAIDVAAIRIEEEATRISMLRAGLLGEERRLRIEGHQSKLEYRLLFSSYREGLSSTNTFFQALSFWRVIEGVRALRQIRHKALTAAGMPIRDPSEAMPNEISSITAVDKHYLDNFTPYAGWKFTRVIDELRPVIRNALAHLDPEHDVLVADRFDDMERCEKAVPVLRYMSRIMLSSYLEADAKEPPSPIQTESTAAEAPVALPSGDADSSPLPASITAASPPGCDGAGATACAMAPVRSQGAGQRRARCSQPETGC
jgi:hypothetical protein